MLCSCVLMSARITRGLSAWVVLLLIAVIVLSVPQSARANGGTVQVSRQPAGPYALTVLTSPSPIHVGVSDVGVMVERAETDDLVQDARVFVSAEPLENPGPGGTYEATREQATNKLFYAANVRLPEEGRWRIGVQVSSGLGVGATRFDVAASESSLFNSPFVAMLLLALPMLPLLWWRFSRRQRSAAFAER